MAEVSTINRVVQIGLETTIGTSIAAGKLLQGMMIEVGPEVEVSTYRPSGGKFETVASLDREWSSADISGPITYTEIIYPLSSMLKKVSPTGAGTSKTWVLAPAQTAADTIATFTVELGSAVRAQKFSYGIVTELELTFSTQGNEVKGSMIGKAMSDGITMTTTPTALTLLPVLSKEVSVKLADTQGALTAASALLRVVSVGWKMGNRFGPVWVLNQATDWAAHVELPIDLECTLRVQADAAGLALLTTMRAGATKFMRIGCVSAELAETAIPFSLQIDTACKVTGVSKFEDEDGQEVIEWTMGGFYDVTWTKATEITLVTTVAAL